MNPYPSLAAKVGKFKKNGLGQNRPKGNHSNKKNAFQENPEKRFF
jgi:hypothetical protein